MTEVGEVFENPLYEDEEVVILNDAELLETEMWQHTTRNVLHFDFLIHLDYYLAREQRFAARASLFVRCAVEHQIPFWHAANKFLAVTDTMFFFDDSTTTSCSSVSQRDWELYDSNQQQVFEFVNPLFECPECSIVLPYGWNYDDVNELMQKLRKEVESKVNTIALTGEKYAKTFTYGELTTWLSTTFAHTCALTSIQDVEHFFQQVIDKRIMNIVPYHPFARFENTNDEYVYRFVDDEDPKQYSDLINIREAAKQQSSTWSLQPFAISTVSFMLNLQNLLSHLFEQFIKYQEMYVDYKGIAESDAFFQLCTAMQQLPRIHPEQWSEDARKAFFINVYNFMALHAILVRGCANTRIAREEFMTKEFYMIGKHKYSLADIYYGILRGQAPPAYKSPHLLPLQVERDIRITFAVSSGVSYNALPIAVTPETLDEQLTAATKQFVLKDVEVDDKEREIRISPLFAHFHEDFQSSPLGMLAFISEYLPDGHLKRNTILSWLYESGIRAEDVSKVYKGEKTFPNAKFTFKLKFKEEDHMSQRKGLVSRRKSDPLAQALQEIDINEVKEKPKFRQYFKKFCQMEYSAENINFYEMFLEYKQLKTVEDRYKMMQTLYDDFLLDSAPFQINVNKKLIKEVDNVLKQKGTQEASLTPTPESFDNLMNEVNLVLLDTYSRFKVSELFHDMVEERVKAIQQAHQAEIEAESKKDRKSRTFSVFAFQQMGAKKQQDEEVKTLQHSGSFFKKSPTTPPVTPTTSEKLTKLGSSSNLSRLRTASPATTPVSDLLLSPRKPSNPIALQASNFDTVANAEAAKEAPKPETPRTKDIIFGVSLKEHTAKNYKPGPLQPNLEKLLQLIEQDASNNEGVFRIPGQSAEVKQLRNELQHVEEANFAKYNIHIYCTCVKQFLKELPEPLIIRPVYAEYLALCKLEKADVSQRLQELVKSLPALHRYLLQRIVRMFIKVVKAQENTKMTSNAIAISYGMTLVSGSNDDPLKMMKDISLVNRACELLIEHSTDDVDPWVQPDSPVEVVLPVIVTEEPKPAILPEPAPIVAPVPLIQLDKLQQQLDLSKDLLGPSLSADRQYLNLKPTIANEPGVNQPAKVEQPTATTTTTTANPAEPAAHTTAEPKTSKFFNSLMRKGSVSSKLMAKLSVFEQKSQEAEQAKQVQQALELKKKTSWEKKEKK